MKRTLNAFLVLVCVLLSGCAQPEESPAIKERNRQWEAFYENYKLEHPDALEGEVLCQTNKAFGSLRSCPGSSSLEDSYDQLQEQSEAGIP